MRAFFLLVAAAIPLCAAPESVSLFDGKTLDGWEIPKAEEKWWTVRDGMISAGSMEENMPINTFLSTKKTYADFEMTFNVRLVEGKGFANSGIQVRSTRKGSHMSGYQVDAGKGYWGTIWDEHRRNKKIAVPVDEKALAAVVKDFGWNEYRILCEGPRIRTWINGVLAIDYMEKDPDIPLDGYIGLQAHKGGTFLVEFKDIAIKDFAAGKKVSPLAPEDEKASFSVPEGYEIELVASEEQGVGKPITVTWDSAGRMWTMTAYEYPVDANENMAQAEALYAKGGKDKILVFDTPNAEGPQTPRVFANRLVIPLGLVPTKKGAIVQYGSEIRHYIDDDGDGKADRHEVLLEGFGFQDSHLFPHQFEYAPGGWIYVAQGLFNYSVVKRPDGKPFANGQKEMNFRQCKLARFREDGSDFELLTAGPNNIWGLGIGRDGEVFAQEANDMGIPIAEFLPGVHYTSGSREKLKSYAPQVPASFARPVMGGSGLSGLAIAEDEDSAFSANYDGRRTFYIANPITNRIQIVTLSQDENGRPTYQKEEDFLTSTDNWFRPVAVHFGPDGAMYVVDWYNKVISHNEVPRAHPDRDKTRGRIWRIKPKSSALTEMPDLASMKSAEIVKALDHPNARVTRIAWKELGVRKDASVVPQLEKRSTTESLPLVGRLASIWALQEMAVLSPALLTKLATDDDPHVRYEAVHAAGDMRSINPEEFISLIRADEKNFRVRSIAATALRRLPNITPAMLATVSRFVEAKSHGSTARERYESDFIRYQVRWAFEANPNATAALLESDDLALEARSLAILSLPPSKAAIQFVSMLPTLGRPLNADELEVLGGQLKQAGVGEAFQKLLSDPATREGTLSSLLSFDVSIAADENLRTAVAAAAGELDPGKTELILSLARRFRLTSLAPSISESIETGAINAGEGLKTLNEIGAASPAFFEKFFGSPDTDTKREALIGYSSSAGPDGVAKLAGMWSQLPGVQRQLVTDGMLSSKETAVAFAEKAAEGAFENFGGSAAERLVALLGIEHPAVRKLFGKIKGLMAQVISLNGKQNDGVKLGINLKGAFTIETWVRFDGVADNQDSLLGDGKKTDFNFHQGKLRLYAAKDLVVASRAMEPDVWTHFAITRDGAGTLRIFIDGEPDAVAGAAFEADLKGLDLGISVAKGGTSARFMDYRIWGIARSEDEIQIHFKTHFEAVELPDGLLINLPAEGMKQQLTGGAKLGMSSDFPALRTPAETAAIAEKFTLTRKKTELSADPANGMTLVQASCMICHQINGEGQAIGPDLSGAGAMGLDALLHNVLLPNEQLESGYYRHDVTLKDGSFVSGFLSGENKQSMILRQIGADDRVIPRGQIASHEISKRSLMPEGLIDSFTDQQVADLFAYLLSLK